MPKPTLQNRRYFKEFLKRHRDKFTSGIQTCQVGDISAMFSQSAAGISSTTDVNLLLISGQKHDNNINLDSIPDGSLVYFPTNSGDYVNVGLNSLRYQLYFSSEDGGITFDGNTYNLNDTFDVGSKKFTVKALGGALVESNDGPVYSVSTLNASGISTDCVYEGESVNIVVNTQNVNAGTTLYYTTVGVATEADFSDNSVTGSFNIVGTGATTGIATIVRTTVADSINEYPDEDFTIKIRANSLTGSIVAQSNLVLVKNSPPPPPPIISITPNATSVNEGSSVSFTVDTINVPTPGTLYYSTGGTATAEDFSNNSTTGSFNVVSTGATTGIGTIVRSIATDAVLDGDETFNIVVRTGSTSGPGIVTSSDVTIGDVAPTYSITPNILNVDEGGSVLFTVTSTISTQLLYYTVISSNNALTDSDFENAYPTSGLLNITNGEALFNLYLKSDRSTEGPEKFSVELRDGGSNGAILATSPEITINDTSLSVGANANNLTFGPVRVNRDDGNILDVCDWYDICSLDQLPEGGKVAIFIDTSGSMNMRTVSQSYDKLVQKLNERNITIITVTNPNEDWIAPFLTDLT